jgi:Ti type entry exclusion protein TrbK
VKPSTTIMVIIAIGAGAVGAWWLLAPHAPAPASDATSRAHDFFKAPQGYKTTGGQKMKPRW